MLEKPIDVKLPDRKNLKATKIGTVEIYFKNYYGRTNVTLNNVYYVKEIKQNLSSFSRITKICTIVVRNESAKIYNYNRKLITIAEKQNKLYTVKSFVDKLNKEKLYVNVVEISQKEKWHR